MPPAGGVAAGGGGDSDGGGMDGDGGTWVGLGDNGGAAVGERRGDPS